MSELYKMLIVDDEHIILKGLMSFDWKSIGFDALHSATNGREALNILETTRFDVVLTDIRMPELDGLMLSQMIQDNYPMCTVVILSGHKDFEYAKAAIKNKVYEYLLKPINLQELEVLFRKLKLDLDKKKEATLNMSGYKKQLDHILPFATRNFFVNFLGKKMTHIDEVQEQFDLFEISMLHSFYACLTIRFIDGFNATLISHIENYIYDKALGYLFSEDNSNITIILNFDIKASSSTTETTLIWICEHIKTIICNSLLTHDTNKIAIGVGNIYNNIMSLPFSFEQSKDAADLKYFNDKQTIFYAWKQKSILRSLVYEYPYDKGNELLDSIFESNVNQTLNKLDAFWEEVELSLKYFSQDHIKNIAVLLLNSMEQRLVKSKFSLYDIVGISQPFEHYVSSFNSFHILKNDIKNIIIKIITYLSNVYDNIKTSSYNAIKQAVKYVEVNYAKKISLVQIAEHVSLSTSYFSIQFKTETGKNFTDYLNDYRLEKSKELLRTTHLKIYEIAFKVGYKNPKYFTDIFKKNFSISPNEYKKKYMT